jgi:transposase
LLAADYLPAVWVADEQTQARRRQVARRAHIVRQRTRLKNQVQAVLHRNLIERCPAADLFGNKGRAWLAGQRLPADERQAAVALLRQLDFHGQELALIDRELAKVALGCQDTRRLMTIPGVDVTVAMSITSAVGDFSRFASPDKLVRYLGLNPRITQSGGQPASHGRITKQGRAHARGMLVEAAWWRSRRRGRCARSMSACAPVAACRSPSWRPHASSACRAGT